MESKRNGIENENVVLLINNHTTRKMHVQSKTKYNVLLELKTQNRKLIKMTSQVTLSETFFCCKV